MSVEDWQAGFDARMAALGMADLDMKERVVRRKRLALQEQALLREQAAAAAAPVPPHLADPKAPAPRSKGAASSSRGGKSVSDATLQAVRAIAAGVHEGAAVRQSALGLAKAAAVRAQELELPGADALNPAGSSMRDVAQAVLEGIGASEAAGPH